MHGAIGMIDARLYDIIGNIIYITAELVREPEERAIEPQSPKKTLSGNGSPHMPQKRRPDGKRSRHLPHSL